MDSYGTHRDVGTDTQLSSFVAVPDLALRPLQVARLLVVTAADRTSGGSDLAIGHLKNVSPEFGHVASPDLTPAPACLLNLESDNAHYTTGEFSS